jgi:hypothetical protein
VGEGDQGAVVVPADPGAAFLVVEAELAFELFVVELDLPAQPGEPGEPLGLAVGWQVAEPVVDRRVFAFAPFGDQELLAAQTGCFPPVVGGPDRDEHEPGADGVALGPSRNATV